MQADYEFISRALAAIGVLLSRSKQKDGDLQAKLYEIELLVGKKASGKGSVTLGEIAKVKQALNAIAANPNIESTTREYLAEAKKYASTKQYEHSTNYDYADILEGGVGKLVSNVAGQLDSLSK